VRGTEGIGGARFYFNENERILATVATNQIDFTTSFGSEILVKDTKPVPPEIFRSHFLTGPAQHQVGRSQPVADYSPPQFQGKRNTSEPPAQMSADESGRDRGSVNSEDGPAFHSLCSGQNRIAGIRYAISASYGLVSLSQGRWQQRYSLICRLHRQSRSAAAGK
jgi:hypothetical protein